MRHPTVHRALQGSVRVFKPFPTVTTLPWTMRTLLHHVLIGPQVCLNERDDSSFGIGGVVLCLLDLSRWQPKQFAPCHGNRTGVQPDNSACYRCATLSGCTV